MRHTCPDGKQSKLNRHGPVGTMVGVRYTCPNCGWSKSAEAIWQRANELRSTIVTALSR